MIEQQSFCFLKAKAQNQKSKKARPLFSKAAPPKFFILKGTSKNSDFVILIFPEAKAPLAR